MADPVRDAAQEFLQAYGEHLNHHCAKCTAAWAKLRDALEAPAPDIPMLTEQYRSYVEPELPKSKAVGSGFGRSK